MGAIASVFGGGKKKSNPAPVAAAPVVARKKQSDPGATDASKANRAKTRGRSSLVSGRAGAPTRSGISVPGS